MPKTHLVPPLVALLLTACGGSAPPTPGAATPTIPASTATAAATASPASTETASPSSSPAASAGASPSAGSSLDPSQSDAGIVATVTISNDTRSHRDGTHSIAGVKADSSSCGYSFEGDAYNAIAWYDAAPEGQIFRFGVTVPAEEIPEADGQKAGIEDARVSFEFDSASGFGTQYSGDSSSDKDGQATVNVTRSGDSLSFDFTGTTYDNVNFAGSLVCADAGLTLAGP